MNIDNLLYNSIMVREFESRVPKLASPNLADKVRREAHLFVAGSVNSLEITRASTIVECARAIAPFVCGAENKTGFVMALTKRAKGTPVLTVQIGRVDDPDPAYSTDGKLGKYTIFANLKTEVLIENPNLISSSQNLSLPAEQRVMSPAGQEIPGGAIAFENGWIIAISGFRDPNTDTATALAIGIGAKLIGLDDAERVALDPRVNCKIFMEKEDLFIRPFLH